MMHNIETLLGHLEELLAEDLAVLHAELDVEEVRPNQLLDLASQLRGVGVLLGIWRREKARYAPAVHRFGRIAWRHTDQTRPLAVTSQHIPDSGQADRVGVGGPPLGVGVPSAVAKTVEPQPAGASARGHHLPGGDGDGGSQLRKGPWTPPSTISARLGICSSILPKSNSGGAESSPMTITRRDMPPSSFDIAHEPELLHCLRIDVHAAGRLLNLPQERLGPESEHLLQLLGDVRPFVHDIPGLGRVARNIVEFRVHVDKNSREHPVHRTDLHLLSIFVLHGLHLGVAVDQDICTEHRYGSQPAFQLLHLFYASLDLGFSSWCLSLDRGGYMSTIGLSGEVQRDPIAHRQPVKGQGPIVLLAYEPGVFVDLAGNAHQRNRVARSIYPLHRPAQRRPVLPLYQYFGRYEASLLDPLPLGCHGKTGLQIRRGAGAGIFKLITLDKLVGPGRHRLAVSIQFHVLAEGGGPLRLLHPDQGQKTPSRHVHGRRLQIVEDGGHEVYQLNRLVDRRATKRPSAGERADCLLLADHL